MAPIAIAPIIQFEQLDGTIETDLQRMTECFHRQETVLMVIARWQRTARVCLKGVAVLTSSDCFGFLRRTTSHFYA